MLRVAVPNKGTLSQPAREMLAEAGYSIGTGQRELMVHDPHNQVEFFFLRPKDIATYVGGGALDLGITGLDMLIEAGRPAEVALELGFGASTFRLAVPTGTLTDVTALAGTRIATSYPALLREWLAEHNFSASVVKLEGAVENAVRLGVADAIADVVDTGTTLKMAGLSVVGDPLLRSQAVLVRNPREIDESALTTMLHRLHGVLVARSYVIVDYDMPVELVDAACAITPGIESPTVSPLRDPTWVAIRAMVPRTTIHAVMDQLFELGGRGILVTDIHACRL